MRAIDYNGYCPDDDGPATQYETDGIEWIEDYLRYLAERDAA